MLGSPSRLLHQRPLAVEVLGLAHTGDPDCFARITTAVLQVVRGDTSYTDDLVECVRQVSRHSRDKAGCGERASEIRIRNGARVLNVEEPLARAERAHHNEHRGEPNKCVDSSYHIYGFSAERQKVARTERRNCL